MEIAKERVRNWTSGPLDLSWLGLTELPELPVNLTELLLNYLVNNLVILIFYYHYNIIL
jgi:hypothetical protein